MSKTFVSVEKALDILTTFDFEHPEISAQEISDRLSIPLSSVYKYLEILSRKGFLSKSPDSKKYILGLTIFQMLNVCIVGKKLIDIALSEMELLREETGETIYLTVPKGWEVMCLEKVDSKRLIKLSINRGETKPIYAGADGKVVLAYQDQSFIEEFCEVVTFQKFTENTPVDCDQLLEQIETIREHGFAYSDSELDEGAIAVAAPIFDHKKKLAAVLAIAGPKDRGSDAKVSRWAELVMEKSQKISRNLGFRGRKIT
ncbi:IclR family transcriptional regulator [Desulforhopalus singaporensis]|uniref:Transcriptional regulator, IclR family n=1 Tax=Desulforhopalus singaporensis TaxID=91360 RepID=A0A1H0ISB0_9BACT|nr:IclR family transcriptional regulator [Desulforhopalus singaporensis]SDO34232.1 transcriptional regulator, IclR family [Desulforhopalus singaporensis]